MRTSWVVMVAWLGWCMAELEPHAPPLHDDRPVHIVALDHPAVVNEPAWWGQDDGLLGEEEDDGFGFGSMMGGGNFFSVSSRFEEELLGEGMTDGFGFGGSMTTGSFSVGSSRW
eukprot:TRINITY_DN1561_c0_g1_i16.p2 TRINITY_DN1561_c0_g1~~TRINITY_DN1561_c0_g1_i16.p2  ORF type:complete len:114 (-),score=28.61 TRINITY_DN1561_c0_g1_i16:331-672(-)